MHAAVIRTEAVKLDMIPAGVQRLADAKLDHILSHHITALGAVKLDLIPVGVQRLAAVKLDLIISCQITALGAAKLDLIPSGVGQPVTAIISLSLKWLHHSTRETATAYTRVGGPVCNWGVTSSVVTGGDCHLWDHQGVLSHVVTG